MKIKRAFLILLACSFISAHAFMRSYQNYSVWSRNKGAIAQLKFDEDKQTVSVSVFTVRGEKREFQWQVQLSIPISETIHLSDDGQFMVLEDHYPYTGIALRFYKNGKEVHRFGKDDPALLLGRNSGFEHHEWSRDWWGDGPFTFLTTDAEPAFCIWYSATGISRAWRLQTGEAFAGTNSITKWKALAISLAEEAIKRERKPPPYTNYMEHPHPLPNFTVAIRLLAHFRPAENKKLLRDLVREPGSTAGIEMRPDGDSIQIVVRSLTKSIAEQELAIEEGLRSRPGPLPETQVSFYLGSVRGEIVLPDRPATGAFWLQLEKTGEGTNSAVKLEPIFLYFPELEGSMREVVGDDRYKLPRQLHVEWAQLTPGAYKLRTLWRKDGHEVTEKFPSETENGDYVEEDPVSFAITAGKVTDIGFVKCARRIRGGNVNRAAASAERDSK